eukprot:6481838-Amphidinium_carterae.2
MASGGSKTNAARAPITSSMYKSSSTSSYVRAETRTHALSLSLALLRKFWNASATNAIAWSVRPSFMRGSSHHR